MSERTQIERDVFAWGAVLTGDRAGAIDVFTSVFSKARDPRRLAESRALQLTALASRSRASKGDHPLRPSDERAGALWDAARALDPLQREPWLLTTICGLDADDYARAIGFSRTAAKRLIDEADSSLRAQIEGDYVASVEALRAELGGVPIRSEDAHRIDHRMSRVHLRRRLVVAVQALLLLTAMALLVFVLFDLQEAAEEEDAMREVGDRYSNPIPEDAEDQR